MSDVEGLRALDVVLTAQCNLRCRYCYQNAKNDRRMPWSTLRAALDLLLASPRTDLDLAFYGGEPLLALPLIRRAVDHVERHRGRKTVAYTVSSNGALLDEEGIAVLAASGIRTQISFDGVEAAQRRRGPRTFAVLDELLGRLRRGHPAFFGSSVHIAITLTGATVRHLADSVAYLLGKGVRDIRISAAFNHDPTWDTPMIGLLDSQFERLRRDAERHFVRTGEVPLGVFRKHHDAPRCRPERRSMCGIGRGDALTVDVDGGLSGCVTLAESYQEFRSAFLATRAHSLRLGDVRDPRLPERLRHYPEAVRAAGIFSNKQDKYSSYGRCGECAFFADCTVCPVSIGHLPGNTDPDRVPDLPCAFQRVALQHRALFPTQPGAFDLLTGRAPAPELAVELLRFVGRDAVRQGRRT